MNPHYDILIPGFAAKSSRGFLGWSAVTLLHSAQGPALFDTGGAGDRLAVLAALAARGIAPEAIRTVILSHLHFDHIANIECFPGAEIVLHESEAAYLDDCSTTDPAIPLHQATAILRSPRLTLVSGELDVLPGIAMMRTPGHTGGHVSLVLRVDGDCVVLAQDAVKHRGELETGLSAGAHDPAAATASIRRIAAMADVVVPGHDSPLRLTDGRVTAAAVAQVQIDLTFAGRSVMLEY